ncbi:MAG: hypothetical protein V8Q57_00850 [Blautia sp.]
MSLLSMTLRAFVTYALYEMEDQTMKKFPPKMVENRILFETNDDFTDNGRALFDYMVENGYNTRNMSLCGWSMIRRNIKSTRPKM